MKRAALDRLSRIESVIGAPTRDIFIFDDMLGSDPAEQQIKRRTATGDIRDGDRITVIQWLPAQPEPTRG